eukprot:TRINITY_DN18548_c0_g1_i1.p1 TRINITY_DN18548_c0_g1~~TRINITY_DN18548_c0_g1_i1.p1  ORF type:complete len:1037 (+),score=242.92 TRINITY_DN18548_c0_g1_i1:244-3111(+)
MAGAALCVNVGMCHERKDLPGLAHFLEHMLFTGTKKYPKEGDYHEFMQQNGGMANAYTTCYFTNFMFEVKPDALEQALDRFSRFFWEPLLTKDCTDREINAVDSEFQGGFTQPWWRYVGIMNMSANPDHPFHVAVGNNKVLRDEPKERGVDLYEEMKKLYEACYSANGMTLCVIAKENMVDLKKMVKEKFAAVVNKGVTMPIGDAVSDKPPFLPKDWNRLLLQSPVKDVKELAFSWVLPYQGPLWKSKPTLYVAHLLGYEGEGSVISVLKQKGLISSCYCGDGGWIEGAFSLLNVTFDLTDKGLHAVEEIGAYLFTFVGLLQKTPVQKWIFDEMMNLRRIQFQFGEDKNPFDLCPDVAMALQRYPPSEALAGDVLLYEYDAAATSDIISKLTLDGMRVTHQAKCLADRCTEKDTSYDSPMAFLPLEAAWLKRWGDALSPGDGSGSAATQAAAALGLHLPKPNPFIPEDLSLRSLPASSPALPVKLPKTSGSPPLACIFHRQDDAFRQPKAHVVFAIHSPYIFEAADNYMRVLLWSRSVMEALSEYAYDAQVAGVSFNLGISSGSLSLTVSGFNDKLGVLLNAVTDKMRSMAEVPQNVFEIVYDAYSDEISNKVFHSPPYSQCGMRYSELATRGNSFPLKKLYDAFQKVKREDLAGVFEKLVAACHVEAIVLGNVSPADAEKLGHQLAEGLQLSRARALSALPERKEAALENGETLWSMDSTDEDDPNHAVFVRIQMRTTIETESMLRLVDKVLSAKFFDVLRTQQQLGYIVQLATNSTDIFSYLIALVQTEFPPDYARSRIDAFFDEHLDKFEEMLDEEEFESCKLGLLSELMMKPKNLHEEMGNYARAFQGRSFDFDRRNRIIQCVEKSTAADVKVFVRETLRRAPRLYQQVQKTLDKPDKALPEDADTIAERPNLRKWTGHESVVEAFGKSAKWISLCTAPDAADRSGQLSKM